VEGLKFAGWWRNRERKGVSFLMVNLYVVQRMAVELGGCMSGGIWSRDLVGRMS